MHRFFAVAPKGLEPLLLQELEVLGAQNCKATVAGVAFEGELEVGYRACLWSRIASRVLLTLSEFDAREPIDLYMGALAINWQSHFDVSRRFAVDFVGTNQAIRNSQFGALKVKDAVVDHFTKKTDQRPDVDKQDPDIRIHCRLHRDRATLSLDFSGPALHQRGYRSGTGPAPMKENLAAALLMRAGWQPDEPLIDPMCGAGTLLIEAAWMATDHAPGLLRKRWGFSGWLQHQPDIWTGLLAQAKLTATRGAREFGGKLLGCDHSHRVLDEARANAGNAGVGALIEFRRQDATRLKLPWEGKTGLLLCNPPYGERLGSLPELIRTYRQFGQQLKQQFGGWRLGIISSQPDLLSNLGMRAQKSYKLFNGPLECQFKLYGISQATPPASGIVKERGDKLFAPDFANRLRKNIKALEKWAAKEQIDCYRLYDADLPDYNVAIDRYLDYLVIQEYAAPKSVPEEKARRRLNDIIQATLTVTEIEPDKLVLKTRQKQKGEQQYNKLNSSRQRFAVREYGVKCLVNLWDYLDTGLFLDHRLTRKMLGEMAAGKRFLNLFAYTGVATLHAAAGGAAETTTVDMSRTYLDWARDNLKLNRLDGPQHHFIQSDVLQWIDSASGEYDLIFIDPPTFSNSKRMEQSFDVQRDHVNLLSQLSKLMAPGGSIVFSNNKRKFKIDSEVLAKAGLQVREITGPTLPKDFERNPHIHNCWLVTRITEEESR